MVSEEAVVIKTSDGDAEAFVYGPGGQAPAILYYPDGVGLRPAFHDMARRLAGEGYVVLLPNIYYRNYHTSAGPVFSGPVDFQNPKIRERFGELAGRLTPDAMERDALAYLAFLGARSKGPMGTAGYCLTGGMAMRTAAAAPDRIAAVAAFHGGGLYTDAPTSPHRVLPRIKARLYFGHAENDGSMTAEAITKFEAALTAWGGRYESETYPAQHGWTVPGWEIYDQTQAERAYAKMTTLFAETLK
jgi:carboxymethylenebutenolidase